jgi:hypothetical protein
LTSYLFEDTVVDDWLDKSETETGETIWTAIKPVFHETGDYKLILPKATYTGNLYCIPGDIMLSEYEEDLADSWTSCLKRKIGSFKKTTAISRYINKLIEYNNFDYIFFDSGPNIGPLNRIILLDCDFFIIPAACDLFSIRALRTLGKTIEKWIKDWETINMLAPDNIFLFKGRPHLLGFIPQRFRVYGGSPSMSYRGFVPLLERNIHSEIIVRLQRIDKLLVDNKSRTKLGSIQDYGSIANEAQKKGVPIWRVGSRYIRLERNAKGSFQEIAKNIINRVNL